MALEDEEEEEDYEEDEEEEEQEGEEETVFNLGEHANDPLQLGCCSYLEAVSMVLAFGFKHVLSEVAIVDLFKITDEGWIQDAITAERQGIRIRGIIKLSPLVDLPHFKIKSCFNVEDMHGVFAGQVKYLTENALCSYSKNSYYIGSPAKLKMINEMMDCFRLPSLRDSRGPQRFRDHLTWKASQWKYWLLFFSLPVLKDLLPATYVTHWSLLVKSIFILSSENINESDIEECEVMMLQFVWGLQILYGKEFMSFNAHSILHYTTCVRNSGPLWAYSAFPFESFIDTLLAKVTSSGGVINQRSIMRDSNLAQ
ncbi:hypothetical protein B566_EDAN018359 [Ephemera danica]|nr:hypothetical protein B566_EDAN018359 [Ephemera danica]